MTMMISKQNLADLAMKEAKDWLDAQGIPYLFREPHQLKIGPVNFWPGRGTITVDGEIGKRPEKGLGGLECTLLDLQSVRHKLTVRPTFAGLTQNTEGLRIVK
jgi:hypothetical protein